MSDQTFDIDIFTYSPKEFSEDAIESVRSFYRPYHNSEIYPYQGHLWFACHAAFAPSANPDLLYRLLAYFQWTEISENKAHLHFKYEMVSDILLSPHIFQKVARNLFEPNIEVRDFLIHLIEINPKLGKQRLKNLAYFLKSYTKEHINSASDIKIAKSNYWTSQIYIDPDGTAKKTCSGITF